MPSAGWRPWRWGEGEDEKGMKMRWEWKWDERLLNRDTRRGTQKKRERANTNTDTPGPERANPERARKKKSGGRGTRNKTSGGGGRTEAPEPTQHSETYAYLGTHRTRPTWGGKNAWNRGPNGGLVDVDERKQQLKKGLSSLLSNRALLPKWERGRSSHMGINGCSSSNELDARHVKFHQTTVKRKRPNLKACTYLKHSSCCMWHRKLEHRREKEVFGSSKRLHVRREEFTKVQKTTGAAGPCK